MARLKRLLKRLAIGLAILVGILLLANAGYSWWIGRQLEQRLAALRAAGDPTSFAELAPEPTPLEQDAAAQLAQLAPELEAFAKEHFQFHEKTPLGQAFDKRQDQGLGPTPEQAAAMGEILTHYENLLSGLEQASHCTGYASQIDYSVGYPQMMEELFQPCGDVRTAARFLRMRIIVLLAGDQVDEAVRTGMMILRLARHYEGEPALVNGLVVIAVRGIGVEGINLALRAGPVSMELRPQLDEELKRQDDPLRIVHMFKTERVLNLGACQGMFVEAWWLPWIEKGLQIDMIEFYDRMLPMLVQNWHQSTPPFSQFNNFPHRSYISRVLIGLMEPALEAGLDAVSRDVAFIRSLRIVNAITAYTQREGQPPTGLESLELPAAATIDPFSGEPLKLKQTDHGWVVYTVYQNRTDEGGDFKDQADWGLAPAGYVGAE
ncbi:MAG: hypothetical protein ABGX16_09335 [Pirellulales bacterium]